MRIVYGMGVLAAFVRTVSTVCAPETPALHREYVE